MYDILIVGGGTAGLTAAIYARRAGKSVLVLEGTAFGGQITSSHLVENYPALPAVSGLEYTGVLEILAQLIEQVSGGNVYIMIAIIIWGSALASAFIDNIPFAATMIPVIRTLSAAQGVDLACLAWALSMGTDIGGSATPIGASANVVGTSIAAKNGFPVAWGRYCRAQTLPTVLVLAIATLIIFVRYL